MKTLIHAHPQGAYLFRSILEPCLLRSHPLDQLDISILIGPSFINLHQNRIEQLFSRTSPLFNLFSSVRILSAPKISTTTLSFSGSTYSQVLHEQFNLSIDESQYLLNSIQDSLLRGFLSSNRISRSRLLASFGTSTWNRKFHTRFLFILSLLSTYTNILLAELPDVVTVSHAGYDLYCALIIACRKLGIDCHIIQGGYHRSFMLDHTHPIYDTSPSGEKFAIAKALSNSSSVDLAISEHLQLNLAHSDDILVHNNSPAKILYNHYNSFTSLPADSILPQQFLVMLPIFHEISHQLYNQAFYFPTKYQWLESTCQQLSLLGLKTIYFRKHPETDFYQERSLVSTLVRVLCFKYSLKAVFIDSIQELSSLTTKLSRSKIVLETLNYGSSISSELAALGISPIVANGCLATLNWSLVRRQSMITGLTTVNALFNNTSEAAHNYKSTIKKTLAFAKKTGKGSTVDHHLRLSFDEYLFFGKTPNHNLSQLRESLINYMSSYDIKSFESPMGYHYFVEKRTP